MGFALNPSGEDLDVSALVIDITALVGLVSGDITEIELMLDDAADGTISGGADVQVATGTIDGATINLSSFTAPKNVVTSAAVVAILLPMQARVETYAGGAWAAVNEATGEYARKIGSPVYWDRDERADHCASCLDFGAREYESYDVLLAETGGATPADGVLCLGNCRCGLLIKEGDNWTRP